MLEKITKDPLAAFVAATAIGLFTAGLAAANLNTIWVARIIFLLIVVLILVALFATSIAAKLKFKFRIFVALGTVALCLGTERIATFLQPKPIESTATSYKFPYPPIGLMAPIEEPFTIHRPLFLKNESLVLDFIEFPVGGYAGFAMDNDKDDVMLVIQGFDARNLSVKDKNFEVSLHITGEGKEFVLPGNGKGRWERQLNMNDFISLNRKKDDGLPWLLSPIVIPAGKRSHGMLGFVVTDPSPEIRELVAEGKIDRKYKAYLTFIDTISAHQFSVQLPFGSKPVPDEALIRKLKEIEDN